ncbi:carbon-phosphorus lyase [Frondihabitans sucicola]|uniref:Carbon-phosphorus lyase n=1 Tax=Frondihabitans sucicola TaxID=1268041 RepID=A0ABN6Y623_9MICO|nr:phosphonate C-P lyase system protein PhnH [Frondihabitans sucicola]BDZ51423.1 carbon-phosphorus lyase [Frondihabitans sucicola]
MIGQANGSTAIPAAGFADPTRDAQRAFRAVLDALSHPSLAYHVGGAPEAPELLGSGLGAVALTLLDEESSVWLGGPVGDDEAVSSWLSFHTGARRVAEIAAADFVLTPFSDMPDLATLALGTEEAPHRSATVLVDVRGASGPARFLAEGPGIDGRVEFDAPWADGSFADRWSENNRLFPRGVDLVLVDATTVSALPRTTRLSVIDTTPGKA